MVGKCIERIRSFDDAIAGPRKRNRKSEVFLTGACVIQERGRRRLVFSSVFLPSFLRFFFGSSSKKFIFFFVSSLEE